MKPHKHAEQFKALKEANHYLEFACNDMPKCPHCGHSLDIDATENWDLYKEGEHEVECYSCLNSYMVETNITTSYSTGHQEDENGDIV